MNEETRNDGAENGETRGTGESQEGSGNVDAGTTAGTRSKGLLGALGALSPEEGPRIVAAKYVDRFWKRVDKAGEPGYNGTPCWLWLAALDGPGYGLCWDGKRVLRAHIFSYQITIGIVQNGLHLDHLCRTPRCVNPKHLEPVTCKINVLRGVGSPAQNARKEVCKRGHPLDGKTKDGRRYCKKCNSASGTALYWSDPEKYKAMRRKRHADKKMIASRSKKSKSYAASHKHPTRKHSALLSRRQV